MILLAALAVGVVTPTSGAAPPSCLKPREVVNQRTAQLLVIRRPTQLRADRVCVRATRTRTSVGDTQGDLAPPAFVRVSGLLVASSARLCNDGRYDGNVECEPIVELLDLRPRARGQFTRFAFAPGEISDLLVCPGGRVVGLAASPRTPGATVAFLGRRKTLGTRRDVDPTSLERREGRAIWRRTDGSVAGSVSCTARDRPDFGG